MNNTNLSSIIQLRTLVGYLGENAQFNWWPSNFYSSTSSAFLDPVFSRTADLARYHGVTEAAKLLHDQHIGIGKVFHLFRLPQVLEQLLFEELKENGFPDPLSASVLCKDEAMAELGSLVVEGMDLQEGPIQLQSNSEFAGDDWIGLAASYYHSAFENDTRTFPYMVEVD